MTGTALTRFYSNGKLAEVGDIVTYDSLNGREAVVKEFVADYMVSTQEPGEGHQVVKRAMDCKFLRRPTPVPLFDAEQGNDEGTGPYASPEQTFMERQGLSGDSVKDSNPKDAVGVGKAYLSVVPLGVLWELGLAMLEGSLKYGRHNYRKAGVRASVYFDATMRHMSAWWEGEDIDPDSELSHITKAIASLTVLRDAMQQQMWVDDRPPRPKNGKWLTEMHEKAKALLTKYPAGVRKAPFTQTEHGGSGE